MAIKKKHDLDSLKDLSPEDKSDLSALFDSIEGLNGSIADLRKKTESADKVIQRNAEMETLLKDREKLTNELQEKLAARTGQPPAPVEDWDDLLPFAEFRKTLDSFFESDPETDK